MESFGIQRQWTRTETTTRTKTRKETEIRTSKETETRTWKEPRAETEKRTWKEPRAETKTKTEQEQKRNESFLSALMTDANREQERSDEIVELKME